MKHIKRISIFACVFALMLTGFALSTGAKAEAEMPGIRVNGQRFVDGHGRVRIFHGINFIVGKQGKAEDLDDKFFAGCAARGFNVLRLGLYWCDIQPTPEGYDEDYLASIDPVFDLAAKYGVTVMIELHQDVYGKAASGYTKGAPDWACLTGGAKIRERPRFVWAEGYFWGKGVHNSFDNFWRNAKAEGKGLQDHYGDLWAMMARRWGGKPAFLGYDFMNEPYPGKEGGRVFRGLMTRIPLVALRHPVKLGKIGLSALRGEKLRLLNDLDGAMTREITKAGDKRVRRFDEEKYAPFLQKMAGSVRRESANGIVFMEHSYYSNLGIPFSAARPKDEPNLVYSPHGYDFIVDTEYYDNPGDDRVRSIFEEHRRAQQRLDAPVLVGEWGGEWGGQRWMAHCETLMDLFDSYGWSNAYYAFGGSWKWFDFDGYNFLARPYPMAVSGTDVAYKYDKTARTFTLEYTQSEDIEEPTIIYLPRDGKIDAGGLTVEVLPIESEGMPGARYIYLTGEAGKHRVTINNLQ